MKKGKVIAPAKINLTLEVLGVENGYHNIKSLVTSISLADEITIKLNDRGKITLKEKGLKANCEITLNNAYKAVEKYLTKLKELKPNSYENLGVQITVDKRIPVAGGLGGSSADVAGVLNVMDRLIGGVDIYQIACSIGSDCAYMLKGGLAVISGRGENILKIDGKLKLYLIIKTCDKGVSAKDSYAEYDRLAKEYNISVVNGNHTITDKAVERITSGDTQGLLECLSNHLTQGSIRLVPEIGQNKEMLSEYSLTLMSGSGSSVFGVFTDKKKRDSAYKQLKAKKVEGLIKCETL